MAGSRATVNQRQGTEAKADKTDSLCRAVGDENVYYRTGNGVDVEGAGKQAHVISPEVGRDRSDVQDGLRRVMAEDDPEDIRQWATATLARLGGGDTSAVMTWPQSFDFTDAMLAEYARQPPYQGTAQKCFRGPGHHGQVGLNHWNRVCWPSSRRRMGKGKTIYSEVLAEHWAKHKNRVVFVHYELNRKLMMLRRLARHTSITVRDLKAGILPPESVNRIAAVLLAWPRGMAIFPTSTRPAGQWSAPVPNYTDFMQTVNVM